MIEEDNGVHIIQAVDSIIFVIAASKSCLEKIDVGKSISTTPQINDLYGNGDFSVIVTTTSGDVILLDARGYLIRPINKNYRADAHGQVVVSSGIRFYQEAKVRNFMGMYISVTFEIIDEKFQVYPDTSS